jgi:hypothetical protein
MKKFFMISAVSVLSVLLVAAGKSGKIAHYELSQFLSPDVCGGCHSEIYEQWKGSLHNLSLKDQIYLSSSGGPKGITLL